MRARLGRALLEVDGPTGLVRFDAGRGDRQDSARMNAGDLGCLDGAHGHVSAESWVRFFGRLAAGFVCSAIEGVSLREINGFAAYGGP